MNPSSLLKLITGLFISAALLTACATPRSGDSPPRDGSTTSRTLPGDAIPRKEARSRYGNGPLYKVRGETYRVMDSSVGYQERGVASWYGKKFHGRMTSNQEPYDMYAMTAAHKSLPLPTYVRVRNLKNNRSIIVRVNDRGPFIDNRLIDLSYSAALKLDMVRDGTSLVEVTAINLDEPRRSTPPSVTAGTAGTGNSDANLFVQVGAFGDSDNARRRYRLLRSNGFSQAFVHEDKRQRPTLFRVRIGPVASVSQYDALIAKLQNIGISETHLISD